jgi:hypothetical protein
MPVLTQFCQVTRNMSLENNWWSIYNSINIELGFKIPIGLRFNHFWRKNAFSEFISKTSVLILIELMSTWSICRTSQIRRRRTLTRKSTSPTTTTTTARGGGWKRYG